MALSTSAPLRVLVTDDTALYRRMLSDVFSKIPGVEVAGTSFDGEDCLSMLERLKPDVVTLDINMPRRDGLSTLEEIRRRKLPTQVLMVSAPSTDSAEQTLRALRNGAVDMILKPSGANFEENRRSLESQILAQVDAIRSLTRRVLSSGGDVQVSSPFEESAKPQLRTNTAPRPGGYECLCIGVSTGGPAALNAIIPQLPSDLPVPIFVVQHMPPIFTKSLADHLGHQSKVQVHEAAHGTLAQPGCVYIAPGGKQMKVVRKAAGLQIEVNDDAPVSGCKPSVDYLLHSIVPVCGANALSLILTGMGHDGLSGCRSLASMGGYVLAQSPETCVVYGMPRQIVDHHLACEILPLDSIARRLTDLLKATRCQG